MSAIGAIPGGAHAAIAKAAAAQKSGPSAALSTVRDSDGDFDGTAVGQIDARDFGKGVKFDAAA
jgi:hypothetical protein